MRPTSCLSAASFSLFSAFLAISSAANAQTVIELTDPAIGAAPCIFTTNAGGVAADPSTGRLRATGSFGQNCQTTPIPAPSIAPRLEDWALPANWTTGTSVQVSWAAANADLCVYTGSEIPAGQPAEWPWPATGVACNSSASCATTHNLTLNPSIAGNYKFRLTCTFNGNNQTAAVSEISRAVTAAPSGCAAPAGWTRVTQGTIRYQSDFGPAIANSPTTKFEHVWGQRSSAPGVFNPWPLIDGNMAGAEFGGRQFLALEFTPNRTGSFALAGNPTSFPGGASKGISASISKNCGDFTSTPGAASPTPPGCWFNDLGGAGRIEYGVSGGLYACQLQAGQTYYLNMVWTTLPITGQSTSECAGGGCKMTYRAVCPPGMSCAD